MNRLFSIKNGLLLSFLLAATHTFAATEKGTNPDFARDLMLYIVLGVTVAATLGTLIILLGRLRSNAEEILRSKMNAEQLAVLDASKSNQVDWWSRVSTYAVDLVPVEQEADIMLDHNYDGIQELDNNLPPWWLWMFYASIVYGFFYIGYYHFSPYGMSSHEAYAQEMQEAEVLKAAFLARQANLVNEANITTLTDPASLGLGRAIFKENCAACHYEDGRGRIGPNLTDKYWLHGGDIQSVFKTVKYGVPEKGMISWQAQLSPAKMHQVSSFILSLQDTNPADAKEAQGEFYEAEISAEPQ